MAMSGAERTGVLGEGEQVTVTLVKHLRPEVRYPARVIADDGTRVVVRAPWAKPDARDFGFVRFEPGDVFTERYWRDRWYSIKTVRTGDGVLKGWYCDITRPTSVEPEGLLVTDLDLDLWVSADGRTILRLDEDEFLESGLPERDPEAAEQARRALDELERLAREGGLDRLTA
ncbi:DUF402 domain-containing protein [Streptomyces palmae]|uniref:DUF402 domain-containing protein n=1 Tax=Streptomyces palmae TaxID=1701085 RepID=A0A4Z0H5A3_9ACTN|nr:DUF402 domain-containing protein [Streptomyces palmae]TGB06042.1 DUF402 domain-containing protein [Streptomyces palmae]